MLEYARNGVQVNPLIMVDYLFCLVILSLILGQYGFEDIVRRILMTKVSLLESGPDGNRNKTGYGPSQFSLDTLTSLSTENLIHSVNSGSGIGRFRVHNLRYSFWLSVTEGGEGRTMA